MVYCPLRRRLGKNKTGNKEERLCESWYSKKNRSDSSTYSNSVATDIQERVVLCEGVGEMTVELQRSRNKITLTGCC